MRLKLINYLKLHPKLLSVFWSAIRLLLNVVGFFIPIKSNRIIFASFGGRKFDDSPKAIYDYIITNGLFKDWDIVWAFVEPNKFVLPVGRKIRIDTLSFFVTLLSSRVWISNSGMDRGVELCKNGIIRVETWHGCPLKKIGGEENSNSMLIKKTSAKKNISTIRCAQSEYDREIFARIFNADKNEILLSDLPRNDAIVSGIDEKRKAEIKKQIGIPCDKKVLLYMPTYREYCVDINNETFLMPPINLEKWKEKLSSNYLLLVRAHYAIAKAIFSSNDGFAFDVSDYPAINDLYLIADAMISDYSSSFFDFSVLGRPMFCFAYDLEEYSEKRGLYLDLEETLPCPVDQNEEVLLEHISNHFDEWNANVERFHQKYTPNAGNASCLVVDKILEQLSQ